MNILLLSNEYPPHVYGGAGVHVEHLTRELCRLEDGGHSLTVLCFGEQEEDEENFRVRGIRPPSGPRASQDPRHQRLFDALLRNVIMAGSVRQADIIHCHTWYTHLAGCLLKQLLDAPLVLTTHSLEPHRPWKEAQLGTAYRASTWLERTAFAHADGVIAVSEAMKSETRELYQVPLERIRVVHNGIDLDYYRPTFDPGTLVSLGIDPQKPFILFVGRITRQKGLIHLLRALPYLRKGTQVVLCAGAPDTATLEAEIQEKVGQVQSCCDLEIVWISETVPHDRLVVLYSHADLFVCPSVYEPFGIVNLEAMACGTPVVASAVGGIREAVTHGETGILVPFDSSGSGDFEPRDPEGFSRHLAAAINELLDSPARLQAMGAAARRRVEEHFSWRSIAAKTLDFYREVTEMYRRNGDGSANYT
jgi:alpha-maltose-1-phosphate synthase